MLSGVDSDAQLSDNENVDDVADDDPDFLPEHEENDDEDGEEEYDNNDDSEDVDGSSGEWNEEDDVPLATISELAKRKRIWHENGYFNPDNIPYVETSLSQMMTLHHKITL